MVDMVNTNIHADTRQQPKQNLIHFQDCCSNDFFLFLFLDLNNNIPSIAQGWITHTKFFFTSSNHHSNHLIARQKQKSQFWIWSTANTTRSTKKLRKASRYLHFTYNNWQKYQRNWPYLTTRREYFMQLKEIHQSIMTCDVKHFQSNVTCDSGHILSQNRLDYPRVLSLAQEQCTRHQIRIFLPCD